MRKLFNFYKTPGLKAHECKCFKMFDDIKNGNRLYISIEWIVSGDEPNNIYIKKRAF